MTKSHEVVRKSLWRSRSRTDNSDAEAGTNAMTEFAPGDLIDPTEEELEAFSDRLREVRSPESEEDEFGLSDKTVADVQEELESGEYDESLEELFDAEVSGEDRKGVKEAINERSDEINE